MTTKSHSHHSCRSTCLMRGVEARSSGFNGFFIFITDEACERKPSTYDDRDLSLRLCQYQGGQPKIPSSSHLRVHIEGWIWHFRARERRHNCPTLEPILETSSSQVTEVITRFGLSCEGLVPRSLQCRNRSNAARRENPAHLSEYRSFEGVYENGTSRLADLILCRPQDW
jgi:hypothetical protein